MLTPYKPGDRVVVEHPSAGWRVMTVLDIGGDLSVSDGEHWGLVPRSEVRPAMPRDRRDLERWGAWWWLEDRVVLVDGVDKHGHIALWQAGSGAIHSLSPAHHWRGPVARPPEVRS
jgi:hypothetical protein